MTRTDAKAPLETGEGAAVASPRASEDVRDRCLWEYALSALIPLGVLCAVFWSLGIYPFGDLTVSTSDMHIQYVGFFGWLCQVMHGQGSLFYSFSHGMGGGTAALFAYYLSSPFNLLLALFDYADVPLFFSMAVLGKLSLAGLTCYAFLRKRFSQGMLSLVLSTCYALCGFAVCQASNVMWLDGVYMLPLVALGTWRLVHDGRCLTLFCAVACATLFNWYTSYMACLFSVAYVLVCVQGEPAGERRVWRTLGRYALTMALGLAASAVVFLPAVLGLLQGVEGDLSAHVLLDDTCVLWPQDLFAYYAAGTVPPDDWANVPCIFTGALPLVLAIAGLANRRVGRSRRLTLALLLMFVFSGTLVMGAMNLWSVLRKADSFYFRHAFVISFALVAVAREAADGVCPLADRERRVLVAGSAAGAALLVGLSTWCLVAGGSAPEGTLRNACVGVGALLVEPAVLEAALELAHRPAHGGCPTYWPAVAASVLVVVLACAECGFDARCAFSRCKTTSGFYRGYLTVLRGVYDEVYADAGVATGEEASLMVGQASVGYMGLRRYNGATTAEGFTIPSQGMSEYSSTVTEDAVTLMQALGYSRSRRSYFGYFYNCPMELTDSLIGVDYVIDEGEVPGATDVASEGIVGHTVHRYEHGVTFAHGLAPEASGSVSWSEDAIANQVAMFADATGSSEAPYVEDRVRLADSDAPGTLRRTFTVEVLATGTPYVYLPLQTEISSRDKCVSGRVLVNGTCVQCFGGAFDNNVICLGTHRAGEVLTVELDYDSSTLDSSVEGLRELQLGEDVSRLLRVVTLDEGVLSRGLNGLDNGQRSLDVHDGSVRVDFDAARDEAVFLRVPYEKGWGAEVDGEPVELRRLYGAFCGVDVTRGEHVITLTYETPGLKAGAATSAGAIACFLAWRALAQRRSRLRQEGREEA